MGELIQATIELTPRRGFFARLAAGAMVLGLAEFARASVRAI